MGGAVEGGEVEAGEGGDVEGGDVEADLLAELQAALEGAFPPVFEDDEGRASGGDAALRVAAPQAVALPAAAVGVPAGPPPAGDAAARRVEVEPAAAAVAVSAEDGWGELDLPAVGDLEVEVEEEAGWGAWGDARGGGVPPPPPAAAAAAPLAAASASSPAGLPAAAVTAAAGPPVDDDEGGWDLDLDLDVHDIVDAAVRGPV